MENTTIGGKYADINTINSAKNELLSCLPIEFPEILADGHHLSVVVPQPIHQVEDLLAFTLYFGVILSRLLL